MILELVAGLAFSLALTALPGVGAALVAARFGAGSVPILLAIGLAASGALGLLGFWMYYWGRLAGETYSYLLVLASAAAIASALYGGRVERGLLRQLCLPLGLWALGSGFVVFLGFLHGGADAPLATAATRFTWRLPTDNELPSFYAEWFYANGHDGRPPVYPGEWLASDRPPLQIGYVLSQRPFAWGNEGLNYQLLGVALQQLWIVGVWALLLAGGVRRVTRALTMVTVLLSGLVIVNGFFVWPKLLPAAMLLAVAALVATPLWTQVRRSAWGAVLVATLVAVAILGHGSSAFGVVPLALVAAYRGLPNWRWVGVGLLVGFFLTVPWSMYQKYGDPPGNRVTKWMIAGVPEIDPRGTSEAILDSYGEAGVGGTIDNKAQNLFAIVGDGATFERLEVAADAIGDGNAGLAAMEVRAVFFFNLLPSLGLLLVVPIVMLLARWRAAPRSAEWSFSLFCFALTAVGALVWALLLYGNEMSRAIVHQGSYLIPILALCGAVSGLRATLPRFALFYCGLSSLLLLALYVPALEPPAGTSYSLPAALLGAACLAGFGAVALSETCRRPASGD